MHLWLSVNSIVIWSLLLMCLFGCDLCLSQSDSCSTYNCEEPSLQVSPAVDSISSSSFSSPSLPSSSSSSSSPSSSSYSSSSSSSLPPEETFPVMDTSSSLALFSPFDDTSSSLFYPSSSSSASSSFTSGDFIPIAPRSVASTRRRKSKYLSKSSKKSRFIDPRNTLECHRREYTFKATNTDGKGRRCWQFVTAMSCWGRCHSGEVSLVNTLDLFITMANVYLEVNGLLHSPLKSLKRERERERLQST